jgi:hypothetical protein
MGRRASVGRGKAERRSGAAGTANAAAFAADLAPVIKAIRAKGHTSLREIAAELMVRGMRTRRGGQWGVGNVKGVFLQLDVER